jgi:transposase-like protein
VKAALQAIANAESRRTAEQRKRAFRLAYAVRYPKAVERLERDWERMVSYYAFPKEHWRHLRTTNIVESPFAAVRLRTTAAKRYKRVDNATAMIWRLLLVAEQHFRKLNAPGLCQDVFNGKTFADGELVDTPKSVVPKTRRRSAA